MFRALAAINARPELYARVTTTQLWTDPHISARMLAAHLDPEVDSASHHHGFVERSCAWMSRRFGLGEGHRVADFGCGPGLYANRLARTGAAVTGIDVSERSLEYARAEATRKGVPVRYEQGDYLARRGEERYDLVVLIMRDFAALAPKARQRLLGTVREHMAEGGVFLFDVDSAAAFDSVREKAVYAPGLMDGFWSERPYFGFLNTFRYEEARVALDQYEIVEEERTRTFCNWVAHFTPQEVEDELTEAGFAVEEFLGDVAGAPYDPAAPQFAVVAVPIGNGRGSAR